MSYSTIAHALISYVDNHLEDFNIKEMSKSFGFSEIYLRELFLKNVNISIMQYYKKRRLIISSFKLLHSNKKIVDIALESGFSNHESYTRAFQKLFGILPSKFRLIGRMQLVTGAFELDQLINKEKRSDELIMNQENKNTILYNIPKVEWGAYESSTMFPICVKAVSEYLGDDISYAYIMAATGAAFRLVWNQEIWDLSNIDIYHTLTDSNDIYQYGAKALGREFTSLVRKDNTKKEDFIAYIKSNITKGYPVIALGIIGPPEPCIIAGYEANGDIVVGWNFFQNDSEFSSAISFMDNGYFRCNNWWENSDTQAIMCIGDKTNTSYNDKKIVERAISIMLARDEHTYAKGIKAYDAWKYMLLNDKWFENNTSFDCLFSKFSVQNDAMVCISDGRKWGAKYFKELSEKYGETEKHICQKIEKYFNSVSNIAKEMMTLIGDWNDMEKMLRNFGDRSIREKLGKLIDSAELEDTKAYEQIKLLLNYI